MRERTSLRKRCRLLAGPSPTPLGLSCVIILARYSGEEVRQFEVSGEQIVAVFIILLRSRHTLYSFKTFFIVFYFLIHST